MTEEIGLAAAYATNMKQVVDNFADLSHERARRSGSLQDQLNEQHLRFVDDQHTLVMRMAGNHGMWDNLVFAGEVDATAQGSMANNLANQMRSVAFEAVQSAMAQAAQTSAPAQGTTGVAQGSLQVGESAAVVATITGMSEVIKALGVQLAKLEKVADVLLVKVTGDATEAAQG